MALHPYLFFTGTCRDAFTRYHEIFGGQLEIMRNGDAPPDQGMPGASPDSVMHASLRFGDGDLLMGSDDPTGDGGPMKGVAVSYGTTDAAEAERVFAALADGGKVDMPFEEVFWAPRFGACTDRFGTPWMVSADPPSSAS